MEILNETSTRFAAVRQPHGVDKEEISDTILYLAKLGVSALVSSGTGADDKDPDTVVVSVSAPYRIGLPAKELYQDEKIVKKYEDVASQVLSALDLTSVHSIVDSHALVEFEKKLAAASPDAEDRDDVTVSTGEEPLGMECSDCLL